MYERSVVIHGPFQHRPGVAEIETRWVASIHYHDGQGALSLVFAPDILPFLSQLRERFTSYRLAYVARMTSTYAIRLYELLVQWRDFGERTVELDWLREHFELTDRHRNIRELKRWVLTPAVTQINAHSDLWVEWEQHKRGRVIHALTFRFGTKSGAASNKTSGQFSNAKPKLTRADVERHARPGETWDQAETRLQRVRDAGMAPPP